MSLRTRGPLRRRRGRVAALVAATVPALVAAPLVAGPAQGRPTGGDVQRPGAVQDAAEPSPGRHRTERLLPGDVRGAGSAALGTLRRTGEGLDRGLRTATGPVAVMLELDAAPATAVYRTAAPRGRVAAGAAARRQTARLVGAQAALESRFAQPATRARTLYRVHAAYAGVAVTTDASRLRALAALPGVRAVHRLTPKVVSNSSSVPLIGAPRAWAARADTGRGVRIGVVDTGIDYTHADFGGPGTPEAYAAAKASSTFTGTTRVVGGRDFVGDAYDGDDPSSVPHPDANPIDCEGHGTHVAGTAAGSGVAADGSTWSRGYTDPIDPSDVRIGPGVAPGASLYALKVFGCTGSTTVVGQALDWAADPDGDGDVSDHLDIVNLSLGSAYGSPDDPDAVAADNLAALGTVVVASMGNSGDVYEVGGSPGNARRVLAVAASDDGVDVVDGLRVESPAGIEPADTIDGVRDDVFAALRSADYPWSTAPGVTDAPVVTVGAWSDPPGPGNDTDGCDPYSDAERAAVAGRVVLQVWLDGEDRRCGSVARAANAKAAGAVGVVYGSDTDTFSAGVTGDPDIPAMLLVRQGRDAVAAQLALRHEVRVTLTDALRNAVTVRTPAGVDRVAGFSSRGVGVAGGLKPDVAAPGVTTFSAAVGTGDEGVAESGTSMAAPHVAGEAALVRAAHPGWTVEQVKAAIMNTATEDVFAGPGRTGAVHGPERVGSGRVVADAAVGTSTLAYVVDDPGAVSVSFGPVAVTTPTRTMTRRLRVVNDRPLSSAWYTLSYRAAHPTPGVTYTLSPSSVRVPPRGSVEVTVTATFTRSALRAVPDPTTEQDPAGIGIVRNQRTDASGRIVLVPVRGTSGGALRVPVWSAPRPASTVRAASSVTVPGSTRVRTASLPLVGSGVEQGSGPTAYLSTVSTFQLQATSPRLPACGSGHVTGCAATRDDRGADLRYVGSASDWASWGGPARALATFGISTHGRWRTPASSTEFDVFLDTDGDRDADAVVYNTRVAGTDDFDYFLAELVDLRGPSPVVLDDQLLNGVDGAFDTNVFDSDSLVLPVSVGVLVDSGLVSGPAPRLRWWVRSFSQGGAVDAVASASSPLTLSLASPGLSAFGDYGTLVDTDLPGSTLDVYRDGVTVASDRPLGLLLLHHLGTDGARAQVVQVRTSSATRLTARPTALVVGGRTTLTATVGPSTASGVVVFRRNGVALRTVRLSRGTASLSVSTSARGTLGFTATYTGDGTLAPSTSGRVAVLVRGLSTRTSLSASSATVRLGGRPLLTAVVSPSRAGGTVTFRDGSRRLGTVTVVRGRAVLRAPVLPRGVHRVTASYGGSRLHEPSRSATVHLVVR